MRIQTGSKIALKSLIILAGIMSSMCKSWRHIMMKAKRLWMSFRRLTLKPSSNRQRRRKTSSISTKLTTLKVSKSCSRSRHSHSKSSFKSRSRPRLKPNQTSSKRWPNSKDSRSKNLSNNTKARRSQSRCKMLPSKKQNNLKYLACLWLPKNSRRNCIDVDWFEVLIELI